MSYLGKENQVRVIQTLHLQRADDPYDFWGSGSALLSLFSAPEDNRASCVTHFVLLWSFCATPPRDKSLRSQQKGEEKKEDLHRMQCVRYPGPSPPTSDVWRETQIASGKAFGKSALCYSAGHRRSIFRLAMLHWICRPRRSCWERKNVTSGIEQLWGGTDILEVTHSLFQRQNVPSLGFYLS